MGLPYGENFIILLLTSRSMTLDDLGLL